MALLDGVDLTNPCLVWPKLQEALYKLAAGDTEVRVRFREREVELNVANVRTLERLIGQLKADCERKQGRRARYAIRGGYRQRDPGDGFTGC